MGQAMRKMQKEQAEKLVQMLGQAHEEIEGMLEKGQRDGAAALLGQCQEGAVRLGEMIEQSEGEGFATVSLLETYCELAYGLYDNVVRGRAMDPRNPCEDLQKALTSIKESIEKEVAVRLEVVFLPYKAAMWDSLESVWMAARDDQGCDAYVVPIPYFDKNPDGSLGERHYEWDQYPDDVPVTRYEDYDFARRRPDMIFIHNPYDAHNYVTSVHPFFYSKNLKQYTEKLVYIPYFILDEIDPLNEGEVKRIEDLCVVSGVVYADKVIVQSESMRKIYIDLMDKNMASPQIPRSYWEDKVSGLGSPKLDKLCHRGKEEVKVPKEWREAMEKKDGSKKKVIFYNTSVGAFLRYEEKMLAKIRDVLSVFREYQDEVALLWRPHPLTEATIQSLRPKLQKEYEEIVEKYREQGWGIYDSTAGWNRAVELCDGYYGDWSSLVRLCREAGKPVMVQEVETISHQHGRRLRFLDFLDDGSHIWFCALFTRGLFCFDKGSKKTQFICLLPTETIHESYRALCLKNGKLYLAPVYADHIAIYDIAAKKIEKIRLSSDSGKYRRMPSKNQANFSAIYEFGNDLFFVPLSYGAIVRLDTKDGKVEYYSDYVEPLLSMIHNENAFWFSQSCALDGKMYLPSSCANALVEFDMASCTSVVYKVGGKGDSYSGISYSKGCFWILGYKGDRVIAWDKEEGVRDKIPLERKGKYYSILPFGEGVLRIPCKGNLACDWIHPPGSSVSALELGIEKKEGRDVSPYFEENSGAFCVKIQEGKFWVYSAQRDSLCVLDETGKYLWEYTFEVQEEDLKQYIQMQSSKLGGHFKENKEGPWAVEDYFDWNLACYLENLIKMGKAFSGNSEVPDPIGGHIFRYLKEDLIG